MSNALWEELLSSLTKDSEFGMVLSAHENEQSVLLDLVKLN